MEEFSLGKYGHPFSPVPVRFQCTKMELEAYECMFCENHRTSQLEVTLLFFFLSSNENPQ